MAVIVSGVYALYRPAVAAESTLTSWVPELRVGPPKPLELLSLRHQMDARTFTVTGLVQNPPDGTTVHTAVAVVYLFDAEGNYFAGGHAALEFATLKPGDESAFVVRVPNTARVSRYRVGFRSDAGGAIAHVDRRGRAPSGTTGGSLEPVSLRGGVS
jgi:hypothetical protein